jgi:hypothetical protein
MNQPLLTRIDHLVYSTSDLVKSVVDLETRLGVRPALGGQHPGCGTHNALLALSDRSYLEVIGPDATQAETVRPRWFQIDSLDAPRLVTWAVKEADLNELRAKAKACGIYLGPVVSGTRQRSDGSCLSDQRDGADGQSRAVRVKLFCSQNTVACSSFRTVSWMVNLLAD